jgi:hypothetical protein
VRLSCRIEEGRREARKEEGGRKEEGAREGEIRNRSTVGIRRLPYSSLDLQGWYGNNPTAAHI